MIDGNVSVCYRFAMIKSTILELKGYGLRQAEIARLSGIHPPCIVRLLQGQQSSVSYESGKRLEGIAEVFRSGGTIEDARAKFGKDAA